MTSPYYARPARTDLKTAASPSTNDSSGGSRKNSLEGVISSSAQNGVVRSRSTARGNRPPPVSEIQHIGKYRVIKTIGKGNFAKVKLAKHIPTGRLVAIKIIDKSTLSSSSLQKMFREVRIMKALDHPNIVKLFEVMDTDRCLYLMMEYAPGGEIFDYLAANGRMKEKDARHIFRQIISAVHYCHQKKIVHRDLKAENLLLDKDMNVKIADFGFSNEFEADTKLDTFCGSPPYAAPELFQGKKYTGPEVDIWSLGVILYTLSSGSLPFDGSNLKELREKVIKGKYRVPFYMSTDCESFLKKFLVINPSKRTSLENAMKDKWLNANYEGEELQPYREPVQYVDEDRVETMISMGHTRDDIEQSLHMHLYDEVGATYRLLGERKMAPVDSSTPRSTSSFSVNHTSHQQPSRSRQTPPGTSTSPSAVTSTSRPLASAPVAAVPRGLPAHAQSINYHRDRPAVVARAMRTGGNSTGVTRSPTTITGGSPNIRPRRAPAEQQNGDRRPLAESSDFLMPSHPQYTGMSDNVEDLSTVEAGLRAPSCDSQLSGAPPGSNYLDSNIPPPPESVSDLFLANSRQIRGAATDVSDLFLTASITNHQQPNSTGSDVSDLFQAEEHCRRQMLAGKDGIDSFVATDPRSNNPSSSDDLLSEPQKSKPRPPMRRDRSTDDCVSASSGSSTTGSRSGAAAMLPVMKREPAVRKPSSRRQVQQGSENDRTQNGATSDEYASSSTNQQDLQSPMSSQYSNVMAPRGLVNSPSSPGGLSSAPVGSKTAILTSRFARHVPGRSTVHGGTTQERNAVVPNMGSSPIDPKSCVDNTTAAATAAPAPLARHGKMSFLDKLTSKFHHKR